MTLTKINNVDNNLPNTYKTLYYICLSIKLKLSFQTIIILLFIKIFDHFIDFFKLAWPMLSLIFVKSFYCRYLKFKIQVRMRLNV